MSNSPTLSNRAKQEHYLNRLGKLLATAVEMVSEFHNIPGSSPSLITAYLNTFHNHQLISPHVGRSAALAGPSSEQAPVSELASIQNTLQQLTKAVNSLSKASPPSTTKGSPPKGAPPPSKPTSPSYSAVAGSRPQNASIILDLAHSKSVHAFRPRPVEVCGLINDALVTSPHQQVSISAVRWTAKGNLVVIGGPNVLLPQLQLAAPTIAQAFIKSYSAAVSPSPPNVRANVKWSKLLINGLPTGASDSRDPFTPEECHHTLVANNPSYATLTVTQKPSWVRTPSSYKAGSSSSLVVAFEDQDGSKLKSLLAAKYLFAFGTRAPVKKWKQMTPKPTIPPTDNAPSVESEDDTEDDVIIQTQAQPPTAAKAQASRPTRQAKAK